MKQLLRFTIGLLAVAILQWTGSDAQVAAQSQLKMEDYSHRLSEHMVTDMRQDERGFLWFSTWNGLHRFDGYTFKNYKTYPGELFVVFIFQHKSY